MINKQINLKKKKKKKLLLMVYLNQKIFMVNF